MRRTGATLAYRETAAGSGDGSGRRSGAPGSREGGGRGNREVGGGECGGRSEDSARLAVEKAVCDPARGELKEVVMGWVLANAGMAFTRYADAAIKPHLEAKYTRRLEKMLRRHDGRGGSERK